MYLCNEVSCVSFVVILWPQQLIQQNLKYLDFCVLSCYYKIEVGCFSYHNKHDVHLTNKKWIPQENKQNKPKMITLALENYHEMWHIAPTKNEYKIAEHYKVPHPLGAGAQQVSLC